MTNPIESVKEWIFSIALKKAAYSATKVIVSLVTSAKVAPVLTAAGVTIDPAVLLGFLTTIGAAGLTILQNYLKVKFNLKFL